MFCAATGSQLRRDGLSLGRRRVSIAFTFTLRRAIIQFWRRRRTAAKLAAGASATETTSLASSITNYRFENGRRYHAYKEGEYWYALAIVSASEASLRPTFIAGDRTMRNKMINSTSGTLTPAVKAD